MSKHRKIKPADDPRRPGKKLSGFMLQKYVEELELPQREKCYFLVRAGGYPRDWRSNATLARKTGLAISTVKLMNRRFSERNLLSFTPCFKDDGSPASNQCEINVDEVFALLNTVSDVKRPKTSLKRQEASRLNGKKGGRKPSKKVASAEQVTEGGGPAAGLGGPAAGLGGPALGLKEPSTGRGVGQRLAPTISCHQTREENREQTIERAAGTPNPQNPDAIFLVDNDMTETRPEERLPETIGSRIRLSEDMGTREVYAAVSSGTLDMNGLGQWHNHAKLVECCRLSIEKLTDRPFCGAASPDNSYAKVMGEAMDFLKRKYDLSVPGGWYACAKHLRGQETKPVETAHTSPAPVVSSWDKETPPDQVLTHQVSAVSAILRQDADQLQALTQEHPALAAAVFGVAKTLGVPSTYSAARSYTAAVLVELAKTNETIPEQLLRIHTALNEKAEEAHA